MPWARLDDSLYEHPKLDELGSLRLPCVGLWTLALSWSNRWLTDGFIPRERIKRLGGSTMQAEALVRAGLFESTPDGYLIHDFLEFNDSRATVSAKREQRRAAGHLGGKARADKLSKASTEPISVMSSTSASPRPVPSVSRPDPTSSRPQEADEEAVLNAYQAVGGSVRSEKAVAWLYRLVTGYGADPVIRLIGKLAPSVRIDKLIGEVEAALVRGRVETAKAEDEDQAARARTNREERAARKLAYLRGEITEAEYDSGMKP